MHKKSREIEKIRNDSLGFPYYFLEKNAVVNE